MENLQTKEFYDFGAFRLDVRNRLLFRDDAPVALTLKEFEVLLYLISRAGEVVEKDALLATVWQDAFVEEATLARNISRLRKKLETGDAADKIIETLPKRGYRFLPVVTRRERITPAPVVLVEEEIVRRVRVEETVTLTPEELRASKFGANGGGEILFDDAALTSGAAKALLPPVAENPSSKIKNSRFVWLAAGVALATIVVSVYFVFLRPPVIKSLIASRVTAFSGLPGREDAPAYSPDGKQLTYIWNGGAGDAKSDVYVRLTNGGEPVRLTDTPDAQEMYPVFSPDGTSIAFVRDYKTSGEVYLLPALGGAERRIARLFSGNFSISFAPDGKSIAVIDTEDSTAGKQAAIYSIDLTTGNRRRVTAPAEFRYETTPRFAPDGKSIAFVRVFDGNRQDLFIARIDDAPATPVQITFDEKTINSLAWSADAREIFFTSFRGSNRPALWRVPTAGGEPEVITTGSLNISNLAVAPDGKTVAFVENVASNLDIWQATIDDPQPAKSFLDANYNETDPVFTPDGKSLVFCSGRGGKPALWMVDRDGKNSRQLTGANLSAYYPAVSPDDSRIVFTAGGDNSQSLSIIEIETGKTVVLTEPQVSRHDTFPAWSADGKWIYFISDRAGAMNIWKIAADGASAPVQITRDGAFQAIPAPDGKTIYYKKEKTSSEAWRVSTDGDDERRAPEFASVGDFKGVWSGTAQGIYFFIKAAENDWTVKFFDYASRRFRTAGTFHSPADIFALPVVAPDGAQIFFARNNPQASSIMIAEIEK